MGESEISTDQTLISYVSWCFWLQSESFEVARIFSEAEARRVGCLLQISSEALQTVITHRVTVSSLSRTSQLPSIFQHMCKLISSLVHRRRSTTGSTALCLWKVPLNPGKKISSVSHFILSSLINKTPRYMNSFTLCNNLPPTRMEQSTIFQQRTMASNLEIQTLMPPLHSQL